MLRRLVLATLCLLCLSGVTYAQRVASKDPSSRDSGQKSVGEAYKDFVDKMNNGTQEEAVGAWRDWVNARESAPRSMPDVDRSKVRGAAEVDRTRDWDRRMEGERAPSRDRSRSRDSAGRGDRGGRADRSSGADRSGRDRSSDRGGRSGGSDRSGGSRDRSPFDHRQ
jgi:hypothetical protein